MSTFEAPLSERAKRRHYARTVGGDNERFASNCFPLGKRACTAWWRSNETPVLVFENSPKRFSTASIESRMFMWKRAPNALGLGQTAMFQSGQGYDYNVDRYADGCIGYGAAIDGIDANGMNWRSGCIFPLSQEMEKSVYSRRVPTRSY